MSDPYGRPPLPPASKSTGEVIARFRGWVDTYGSTTKGYDRIILCVEPTEKYKMLRLTDEKGILLDFVVSGPKKPDAALSLDDEEALLDKELRLALEEGDT